ncbi:DUF2218 domain-containing protein [Streptomyces sp. Li-HN-5-11]|uniref:DUF2218 domain-containing protein n=1 Tax=Streptomyces sp. Li-HN-5-11 TaxID=3075432 RepID=UPI0028AE09BA|nr:DUF2218 domain-containing protein [Streptomyces sp. Li-HN-5-11]WNM33693.1 DUF2218 domain-containing protein [Streptomyces sp. Li-HN-5-11]
MPTAEAHIPTERASRYLVQFCRHLGQMSRMRHQPPARHGGGGMPPTVQDVDYSDTRGVIAFDEGQFTLQATSDTLSLRVDADDEDALQRLRNGITARLEKIGRRDQLTVNWQRCQTPPGPPGEATGPASAPQTGTAKRPGRGWIIGLMAVVAVIVAVHLGLVGAALAASAWTGWAVNAVVAIILLKVVFVAGHVALGRFAIRRGTSFRPRWMLPHSPHKSAPATPPTADVAPDKEYT